MISKDLLAQKFYWESTKHCYRQRAGTNGKFLPLKAKALHLLSNPIKAPSQKLPGLSSPQPSANKQTWYVTQYSGWGYLRTSTAWPFWSNQIEIGLKKKNYLHHQQRFSNMENHLSLSLCYLRHNGGTEKAACFTVRFLLLWFRGTTYFPAHLDVNIPVLHFITHQQLCTAFQERSSESQEVGFCICTYQLHWLEWRLGVCPSKISKS